jgi:hypothetical protein
LPSMRLRWIGHSDTLQPLRPIRGNGRIQAESAWLSGVSSLSGSG